MNNLFLDTFFEEFDSFEEVRRAADGRPSIVDQLKPKDTRHANT